MNWSAKKTPLTLFAMGALLCGTSCFCVSACSKQQAASQSPDADIGTTAADETPAEGPDAMPASDRSDAQKMASVAQVECADPAACPAAVGMVVLTTPTHVRSCVAVLVSPEKVATLGRCVPGELRPGGVSCAGRAFVYFPEAAGTPEEKAGCESVLSVSAGPRVADADWAILRVDRPFFRKPIVRSDRGFFAAESLQVAAFRPFQGEKPGGRIEMSNCRVRQRTAAMPHFDEAERPVGTLSGCETALGAVGGAVIDDDGEFRGLLQAPVENLEQVRKDLGDRGVRTSPVQAPLYYATNFACVSEPLVPEAKALPSACQVEEEVAPAFIRKRQVVASEESLREAARRWSERSEPRFGWVIAKLKAESALLPLLKDATDDASGLSAYYVAVPECIRNGKKWIEEYRRGWWTFRRAFPQEASREVALPAWRSEVEANEFLQGRLRTVPVSFRLDSRIEFSPRSIDETGGSQVRLRIVGPKFPSELMFSGALKTCPETKTGR